MQLPDGLLSQSLRVNADEELLLLVQAREPEGVPDQVRGSPEARHPHTDADVQVRPAVRQREHVEDVQPVREGQLGPAVAQGLDVRWAQALDAGGDAGGPGEERVLLETESREPDSGTVFAGHADPDEVTRGESGASLTPLSGSANTNGRVRGPLLAGVASGPTAEQTAGWTAEPTAVLLATQCPEQLLLEEEGRFSCRIRHTGFLTDSVSGTTCVVS